MKRHIKINDGNVHLSFIPCIIIIYMCDINLNDIRILYGNWKYCKKRIIRLWQKSRWFSFPVNVYSCHVKTILKALNTPQTLLIERGNWKVLEKYFYFIVCAFLSFFQLIAGLISCILFVNIYTHEVSMIRVWQWRTHFH